MRRSLAFMTTAFLVFGSSLAAAATITLISPGSHPGGQPPEASVRDWVEWSHSINRDVVGGDPITDPSGAYQSRNQRYSVHMLGGAIKPGVRRSFSIPAGKPIIVPLLNSTCWGNARVGTCIGDQGSREAMAAADRLFLRVNGMSLVDARGQAAVDAVEAMFRIDTGLFSISAPAGSWPTALGLPPDLYPQSYNNGFYAFIELPLGKHEVFYGGTTGEFSESVKAKVEVVPLPPALALIAGGFLIFCFLGRSGRGNA